MSDIEWARHGLFKRICLALDIAPHRFSQEIGVPWKEIKPLLHKTTAADVSDDIWQKIMEYMDRRIAILLAAKMDCARELDKSLQARILRTAAESDFRSRVGKR